MKRLLFSMSLLPLLVPGMAAADTLEDALLAAHNNNPNLEDARLAVRAAREDRVQANSAYLPQIGLSATAGVERDQNDRPANGPFPAAREITELQPNTSTVQLQQQLFTGGRRIGQSQLATAGIENARAGLRGTEQDVLLQAVEAYLSVRRDISIVALNEEHVAGLERQLQGTQRRLQVGEVSRTDLAQTQTRLAGARAALARARAALDNSRARYFEVVGAMPEDLQPAPTPQAPQTLELAMRQAELIHPSLLQARAGEAAARARVNIERSSLMPQVAIVGRFDAIEDTDFENQTQQQSSAVAQLSMPLFEGGFAASRTRQGRINVDRAEARTEAQRRQIRSGVIQAWSGLEAGQEVLQAAREQQDAAETALRGVERERGLGLRSTIDVLNAEEELRDAKIAYARAEAEYTFAGYALLSSIGALSLETLGVRD
ncbi:TolC family outer membrane protein [Terricaulis sp.]|uniref:TolC family outer membrane protein n=1 Tax=Terricaulis sp. TaxID=2768686 RepID=UPI003783723F